MLHLLRTCDTVWSDGWPRLLCNSSNDVLIAAIVISLKKVGVVTTMLSLQGTIDYWGCEEWVFKLSNTYGPPLSWPLGRTILVVRSLKKQEVGCNSKYTRLSLANLKTLSRFLVVFGIWSNCFSASFLYRSNGKWEWCGTNVMNWKTLPVSHEDLDGVCFLAE